MKSFKKVSFFWMIMIPLILPGIIVAAMRCTLRGLAEQRNVYVETVVDFDEFRQLAREDGWTLEELCKKLKENGVSSIGISEDTLGSLEQEGKITVLSTKEIRKLSLEESYEIKLPIGTTALAGLWVHSEDDKLLDRIYQNLSWKLPERVLIRVHRNLLLINKSGSGIMEKVGCGFSEEYFRIAEANDLGYVVRIFNYPGLSKESAYKIINSIPQPASTSAILFADEEMLGARGDLEGIIGEFKNRSYRIGWVEFDTQVGIKEYLKGLSENRPFVRVHSITRRELDKAYTPKRAVSRWVRAVKDRSLKMLYFRAFMQSEKKYIANLTEFNLDYLKQSVTALEKAGYVIAKNDEQRFNEPRHIVGKLIPAERLAIGISLILGLAILLKMSFFPSFGGLSVLLFTFVAVGVFFSLEKSFTTIAGLIGAISYSCIGLVSATKNAEKSESGFVGRSIAFILYLVLPSVIGGLLIAGIYSNIEFMLKFEQFKGIKLAFLVPLAFSLIWCLKKYGKNVFTLLNKPITIVSSLVILLVVGSVIVYVIRSGNSTILKASAFEDAFRTFLEDTLIARPRNKEFLVGYPAAMIFVLMLMRKEFLMLPILAIFTQMGQVSVVNTLCHFHTPIILSLLRIFNGLWLGVIVGLLVVMAWRLLQLMIALGKGKTNRVFLVGYFGYGNAGDELLREIYSTKLSERLERHEIAVLIGKKKPKKATGNVVWVSRRDISSVIEELIRCKAVIVPGGGVFQSITSTKSLLYYLSIIRLARFFGTKVILPAQGLGPWRSRGVIASWLHKRLARELKKADYLTVRDKSSVERYKDLTSPEAYVERTTDLAFLNDKFEKQNAVDKIEFMRVCAVIRSSVSGSVKIAEDLIQLAKDSENLELVPVAFQPGEDSNIWRKAGWKGEIKTADKYDNPFEKANLVVSMRLHGCIIATNMGIPWVGITYDPKVKSFAEASGNADFCCEPDNASVEFFEKCINKLAFNYKNYSKKLASYTVKMHDCALRDFENSVKAITKTLTLGLMLFLICPTAFAQGFSIENDRVDHQKKATFTEMSGPIDPETGKVATLQSSFKKNFRPKLPNFAEMRKKATKTESNGVRVEEEKVNGKIESLSAVPELATATQVLNALTRLASETTSAVTNKVTEEEPADEEIRRRRTYRPGRIKSFYKELKESEQKRQMEEAL